MRFTIKASILFAKVIFFVSCSLSSSDQDGSTNKPESIKEIQFLSIEKRKLFEKCPSWIKFQSELALFEEKFTRKWESVKISNGRDLNAIHDFLEVRHEFYNFIEERSNEDPYAILNTSDSFCNKDGWYLPSMPDSGQIINNNKNDLDGKTEMVYFIGPMEFRMYIYRDSILEHFSLE